MGSAVTLEEALAVARQLSAIDKARLIVRIAPDIERELKTGKPAQRRSLRGLWRGLDITEEDIAEARGGMWAIFPREGV